MEDIPIIQQGAFDYYCTPRASHPNSLNKFLFTSNDRFAAWNAFDLIETISSRPILFIVGSRADTLFFTETAYNGANEPKEIYTRNGASHVDQYYKCHYVEQVTEKLKDSFRRSLLA